MKLTHIILASFLWDIGKQYSPRCDGAERDIPSGASMFAERGISPKHGIKIQIDSLTPLTMKVDSLSQK